MLATRAEYQIQSPSTSTSALPSSFRLSDSFNGPSPSSTFGPSPVLQLIQRPKARPGPQAQPGPMPARPPSLQQASTALNHSPPTAGAAHLLLFTASPFSPAATPFQPLLPLHIHHPPPLLKNQIQLGGELPSCRSPPPPSPTELSPSLTSTASRRTPLHHHHSHQEPDLGALKARSRLPGVPDVCTQDWGRGEEEKVVPLDLGPVDRG